MIFGHKPYTSYRNINNFKLLQFSWQGQHYLEVSICSRCKLVYANRLEQINGEMEFPVPNDLDPKTINI